jgi:stage II sporulation protein D
MGFRSIHYTVEYDSASNKFVFEGAGWGHNVGMSQWGAYSMAQNFNCTYDQILNFYYTDITLSRGVV